MSLPGPALITSDTVRSAEARPGHWIMVRGCQHHPASTAASTPGYQHTWTCTCVRSTPDPLPSLSNDHPRPSQLPWGCSVTLYTVCLSGITPSLYTVTAVTITGVWRTGCSLTEISASTEGPASAQQPRLSLLEAANSDSCTAASLSLSKSGMRQPLTTAVSLEVCTVMYSMSTVHCTQTVQ